MIKEKKHVRIYNELERLKKEEFEKDSKELLDHLLKFVKEMMTSL